MKQLVTIILISSFILVGCENSNAQQKAKKIKNKAQKSVQKKTKSKSKAPTLAPNFTLADLEGNWVSLEEMKGKVVLLNFWGTWCGPCRKEIPAFIKLMEKYQKDGLEIVGVTLSSGSSDNIQSFADKWGINYTLLTDIEGNETQVVTSNYGKATGQRINGIPTTFIIDRQGYIRQRYVGPRPEKVFAKDLQNYL